MGHEIAGFDKKERRLRDLSTTYTFPLIGLFQSDGNCLFRHVRELAAQDAWEWPKDGNVTILS